jgi:predicted dehydrogenase
MKIAIVGCGFVADLYMQTLCSHPSLEVVVAMDIVPAHAERFNAYWKVPVCTSMAELLGRFSFDLVLNLTNPGSHYEVSRQLLEAGKHVYSEKPLAMSYDQCVDLLVVAARNGVEVTSAPCNHLGEAAQAIAQAFRQGDPVGKLRLVYAEIDDGYVALSPYRAWKGVSGAPWPYVDEFQVGCTLEHAGYYLTWLIMLFGPIKEVWSFASLQHPDKVEGLASEAPDFSVACLRFTSGLVARLTCSILAPKDHRFRVVGEKGVLTAENCWFYLTPAWTQDWLTIRRRFMLSPFKRKLKLRETGPAMPRRGAAAMDFARGPAEMAAAIKEGRRSRVPADFALHFNEVSLAIHNAQEIDGVYKVQSTFEPLALVENPIV